MNKRRGASRRVNRARINHQDGSVNTSLTHDRATQSQILEERKTHEKKLREDLQGYGPGAARRVEELQKDGRRGEDGNSEAGDQDTQYADQSYSDLYHAQENVGADQEDEEEEDMVHAMRDYMFRPGRRRRYRDARTWRDRVSRAQKNWDNILEDLAHTYIGWRWPLHDHHAGDQTSRSEPSAEPSTRPPAPVIDPENLPPWRRPEYSFLAEETDAHTSGTAGSAATAESASQAPPTASTGMPEARDSSYDFDLDIIDMVTLEKRKCFPRAATQRTTISIAESGFLPATPVEPSLAVSFRTLEYFRRLRLRKASYSVEAFAKVICDLYGIPYRRRFRTAISDTYDVYLSILRIVDGRVKAYLGEDGPNWRVKNACPACSCKLEGEPELEWDRMFCIDGNNSLKRIAKIGDREIADRREFTASDYYLLAEYVDRFKDEVKSTRQESADLVDADSDSEWEDEQPEEEEGTPADFAGADDVLKQCTENWKAAAKDEKKKMWAIFEETGVFASACRHGFILWVVDMVRSGELAKYALAVVAKALEVFDDRLLIGYDIGCTFDGTIKRSSLGPEFVRLKCRCCVNAFHGYSHSHSCQTVNHPSVIKGAGLEDFEGMERAFSASNELATITRYASKYHRRMHIDRHYAQWDEDKYANLGTMLYNNYRQALDVLEQEVPLLEQWLAENGCREQDLDSWQREEADYFATIGKVTEADQFAVEYVTRLREYWSLEDRTANSMSAFVTSIPDDYQASASRTRSRRATAGYLWDASDTLRRETEMRLLRERRDSALRDVIALELRMGIDTRWTPSTPRFIETAQFVTERDYRLALEDLHCLVVQRLFELQSMNLSHTAYKVRVSIAKSLQRRSKAIRRALRAYNQAAAKLVPARPPLDWTKVSHYAFIEEFELLRDTRNDLHDKRWAQSNTREYMKKRRNIRRAHEEIERCNLEVRRVHTAILLENEKLDNAVKSSRMERNPISGAIAEYSDRRQAVNQRLLAVIARIYALKGFTGNPTPGRRRGTSIVPVASHLPTIQEAAVDDSDESSNDGEDDAGDEERQVEALRMLEFANNLT